MRWVVAPSRLLGGRWCPLSFLLAGILLSGQAAWAAVDISPGLLGMYRKTVEIDPQLFACAARYGVDHRTARAVVLFESGGNPGWVSPPGRSGYFQLSSGVPRLLGAPTNVEAGVKYLAGLRGKFSREDYVLAAYKRGPDRVSEGEPLDLPTLRFVVGVGYYKSVLQEYEPDVRRQAERLKLRRVERGESWESVAQQLRLPPTVLRLYNPMVATRRLSAGALVVHPVEPPPELAELASDPTGYVSRIGDTAALLAGVFGIDPHTFQRANPHWELHPLPVGTPIAIPRPVHPASRATPPTLAYRVRRGDTLSGIARRHATTVSTLVRINRLRSREIRAGSVLRVPPR